MKYTLRLSVHTAEGAIIRILGLVERRGFALARVDTTSPEDNGHLDMELDVVSAERSIDVLMRQLDKLFDVSHVLHLQSDTRRLVLKKGEAC
ncbi:MAG: ACT domain-containing protein [Gammaproteobacteria bacterium]|nr:ACT domain-containing protein [Gammaproteobacteria bacterium]MDH3767836.1 ACT domain-containing protein [Gammaproteobacteria bacterium]